MTYRAYFAYIVCMELNPKQQALKIISESHNILLLTHSDPDGDAVGCILATKLVLENLGKKVTMVAPGHIDQALNFLPGFDQIQNKLESQTESKIIISETNGKVGAISWKRISDNKVELILSGSKISAHDVSVEKGVALFDAVIILDTAIQDRLSPIWEENADLFYEVPTVLIDHHPANTQFAKVNIVDITAAATSEILVSIFEALGKSSNVITKEIATCLLTGLMTDTSSFMNSNTTPKALTVAAQLVAAGADQQQIVRVVFNTNSLPTLRIWGRALSYIKEDQENKFIWTSLSRADFVASGADDANANTSGVMNNLLKTAEGVDFVLLLKEKNEGVYGSFRSVSPTTDVAMMARLFGGGGHTGAAAFQMKDKRLQDVEMEIINKIRAFRQSQKQAAERQLQNISSTNNVQDSQNPL